MHKFYNSNQRIFIMTNTKWYKKPGPYLLALFLIFCSQAMMAQTSHPTVLSFFKKHPVNSELFIRANIPLKKALSKIEKKYNVVFLYQSELLDHQKVAKGLPDEGLMNLLEDLFKARNLTYKEIGGRTFGIVKKKDPPQTELKIVAHRVTGHVTRADNGNTLFAVNVRVKGTTIGTTTDKNGYYGINVPSAQDTLVFSYIGFKTNTVPINGRSVINVTLQTRIFSGKKLVVIGYGTQQKQNVNGAVAHISSEEISGIPEVSVSQLLQGQAAGLSVTQSSGAPGAASSVHIRGITSLTGNNQPLYVIDGVPVSGDANNTATSGQSGVPNYIGQGSTTISPLAQLNPNDIKNITILKDASAAAIYGSRGANGVVIITTKKGQAGHSQISYNGSVGMQEVVKKLDMMNLRQFARLQNSLAKLYPGVQPQEKFSRPDILGEGTNWQDALYQHAAMQNHHLSFSGGNQNITYYISGGYLKQDGIVLGSNFNRYTINTRINAQVTSWLNAGVSINGSIAKDELPINGSYNGAVNLGLLESPAVPVYNADGSFAGPSQTAAGTTEGQINPIGRNLSITRETLRNKLLGNLYAQVNLTKGLNFKSSFSGSFRANKNNQFKPTYQFGTFVNNLASASKNRQNYNYWDWKNYFTYKHTFPAENQITWLVGQEAQKSTWEGISATGTGFVTNDIHTLNIASTPSSIGGFKGVYTMASYYTRLIYSFRNKYGLTATFRADGSSKFDQGHRWGYFPSIAGHWDLYKEPWMQGVDKAINKITLKAGYGVTGSQDIGNFLYTSTLRAIQTGFGTAFAVNNISNPNLTWESQKQLNLGIKFGFLQNRLQANVEWYNKLSSNFLFSLPLPDFLKGGPGYMGGLNPPEVNLGEMRNRGIDVTLKFQTKPSKNFQWSSKLTFSHYKNKVESIPKNITETIDNGFTNASITRTVAGGPVGRFYGYITEGLFRDSTTISQNPNQFDEGFDTRGTTHESDSLWVGDVKYKDVNGDGVVNAQDRTFIGNPNPDFTYGFSNTFNYKNVSLSIFIQGVYGDDIYDFTRREITGLNRLYRNQLAAAADFYTADNPDAKFPRPSRGQNNQNENVSTRFIESGSYLRIKNVTLGYTLPQHITQKFEVNKLKIYGSIQNLHTFTSYSGYDPDIGSKNQNALKMNIDNGHYPEARIFTIGINVVF